jgi:hypothetical protein
MQIGGGQSLIEICEDEEILLVMRAEKRMMIIVGLVVGKRGSNIKL